MATEWINDRPFEHYSHGYHGVRIKAERCDFRGGVTVLHHPTDRLAAGLAECMAWHAINIRPMLNGFAGYDNIQYTFKED